ncbi:MAG: tetratricopeptide repeat protein [Pseudomonadota bacterium]
MARKNTEKFEQLVRRAASLCAAQDYRGAVTALRKACKERPDDPSVHYGLGDVLRRLGQFPQALKALHRAQRLGLREEDLFLAIAACYKGQGLLETAVQTLESAIETFPTAIGLHINLANAFLSLDRLEDAARAYTRALEINPSHPLVLTNLTRVLLSRRSYEAAATYGGRAIAAGARSAEIFADVADALINLERFDEAEKLFSNAKRLGLVDASILNEQAILARARGDAEQAERYYRSALELSPDHFLVTTNLGALLGEGGRFDEAEALFDRAIEVHGNRARAHINKGVICARRGDYAAALNCYDAAERYFGAVDDERNQNRREWEELINNRASSKLALGEFESGWADHEYRWHDEVLTPFEVLGDCLWQGKQSIDGRLLVGREQGIGDEIMFASIYPDVLAQHERVVFQCSRRLLPVMRRSFPMAEFLPADETRISWNSLRDSAVPGDRVVLAGSLPRFFRRAANEFTRDGRFLQPDPESTAQWRERLNALGKGRKIGICWRGGVPKTHGAARSTDLSAFYPLIENPNVKVISLQYKASAAELDQAKRDLGFQLPHWPDGIDEFEQHLNLISALDAVVSVDNSSVHAAGALGIETHLVLLDYTHWRWGARGARSLWYPSVRICRRTAFRSPGEHLVTLFSNVSRS